MTTTVEHDTVAPATPGRGLRGALIALIALAALVLAGTVGWLARGGSSSTSSMSASSVDAGFAQDMSTHHTQAVTMAGYERDNTTSSVMRTLAFDIETQQQFEIGEMQGWLTSWGLSGNSTDPMAWMGRDHMSMGAGNLMPGMATPTQMNQLESRHGKTLDVLFLQLMIHHHQGGLPMARYALAHGSSRYVRDLAQSMVNAQTSEIVAMEQTLRTLGGQPLPAPA